MKVYMLTLILVLLVIPGSCRAQTLDKTGTSASPTAAVASQTLENIEPAKAGSLSTERAGFSDAWFAGPSHLQRTA
jgi:hypothetical protein